MLAGRRLPGQRRACDRATLAGGRSTVSLTRGPHSGAGDEQLSPPTPTDVADDVLAKDSRAADLSLCASCVAARRPNSV